MEDHTGPSLAVVLATPDTFATIRTTVDHLRRQTVREHLEIIIVAPAGSGVAIDPGIERDFGRMRVVEVDAIRSVGSANAAGMRAAEAPLVVLAEDHAYPAPEWAASLIAAHRGPWAVVGPQVEIANRRGLISWADFLIGYGPWRAPAASGVVDFLPGHNSSYKRAVLLEYGDALDAMLEAETVLHWDLRAKGYQLYLESAATVAHLNFGTMSSWVPAQLYNGRLFAATRAQDWPVVRRLFYAAASPLIPLVRFVRTIRHARCPPLPPSGVWPVLLFGLSLDGLGQFLGYALGVGEARRKLSGLEHHRVRHLGKHDAGPPAG